MAADEEELHMTVRVENLNDCACGGRFAALKRPLSPEHQPSCSESSFLSLSLFSTVQLDCRTWPRRQRLCPTTRRRTIPMAQRSCRSIRRPHLPRSVGYRSVPFPLSSLPVLAFADFDMLRSTAFRDGVRRLRLHTLWKSHADRR